MLSMEVALLNKATFMDNVEIFVSSTRVVPRPLPIAQLR